MEAQLSKEWTTICNTQDLSPNAGTCAKFKKEQVAIFFCQRNERLYAVSNFDPVGRANVISRGIMGSIQGKTYVSSPLYKQHFDLFTGACLESPELSLKTYAIRVANDLVQLKDAS